VNSKYMCSFCVMFMFRYPKTALHTNNSVTQEFVWLQNVVNIQLSSRTVTGRIQASITELAQRLRDLQHRSSPREMLSGGR
jgi:hypothetical protein